MEDFAFSPLTHNPLTPSATPLSTNELEMQRKVAKAQEGIIWSKVFRPKAPEFKLQSLKFQTTHVEDFSIMPSIDLFENIDDV